MANPAQAKGGWEKVGTRIGLVNTISTAVPAAVHELRDATLEVWPQAAKALTRFDVAAGGDALVLDEDFVLGRAEPNFTIRAPLTDKTFAIALQSVLQSVAFATGKYSLVPYSGAVADHFMTVEGGVADENAVFSALGCVASSVGISIPTSGSDGGRPEVRMDIMGASSTRVDNFTGTQTVDSQVPDTSLTWSLDMDASGGTPAARNLVSAEINFSNNLARSPNIGATPDAMFLGRLDITGNVQVLLTAGVGSDNDEFDLLMDWHEGLQPVELNFKESGSTKLIAIDVMIEAPTFAEQENAIVATFGFQGAKQNATNPLCEITMSDLGWPIV